MACGKGHRKRRVKLPVRFGSAEPGTIVEAQFCPSCGVYVKAKQFGCNDEGLSTNPSALAEAAEDS